MNCFGWTSLHIAAASGHLPIVEFLVNHKAEINAKDNSFVF